MKPKTLLTLVGLVSLLWSARCASQTSIVPWSASGMGYKVSSSSTSIVKALVGQGFVGTMKGANSLIEAGFLVDTLFRTTVTSVAGPPELPREHTLLQNFPNPCNPSTMIRYGLSSRSDVILAVFNTLGQHVATLAQGEQSAGYHDVRFDGSNLPSGVYFYRLQVRPSDSVLGRDSQGGAGGYTETKRLLLLK